MPCPKKFFLLLSLPLLLLNLFYISSVVDADTQTCSSPSFNIGSITTPPQPIPEGTTSFDITLSIRNTGLPYGKYRLKFPQLPLLGGDYYSSEGISDPDHSGPLKLTVTDGRALTRGEHAAVLDKTDAQNNFQEYCNNIKYKIGFQASDCKPNYPTSISDIDPLRLSVQNAPTGKYEVQLNSSKVVGVDGSDKITVGPDGTGTFTLPPQKPGLYNVQLKGDASALAWVTDAIGLLIVGNLPFWGIIRTVTNVSPYLCPGSTQVFAAPPGTTPQPTPTLTPTSAPGAPTSALQPSQCAATCDASKGETCQNGQGVVPSNSAGIACNPGSGEPYSGDDPRAKTAQGINTAIGCIPTNPPALIKGLFRISIGAGGAIALLLMVGGAFQMIGSAGNPESVKNGSEMMVSAIMGLLVVILSTMFLQIIGVDILQIPGFK